MLADMPIARITRRHGMPAIRALRGLDAITYHNARLGTFDDDIEHIPRWPTSA